MRYTSIFFDQQFMPGEHVTQPLDGEGFHRATTDWMVGDGHIGVWKFTEIDCDKQVQTNTTVVAFYAAHDYVSFAGRKVRKSESVIAVWILEEAVSLRCCACGCSSCDEKCSCCCLSCAIHGSCACCCPSC